MNGVNKVILLGNLGNDPEIRHFDNGGRIAKFSLATKEVYKNKDGNKQENTEWHTVELNNKVAEIAEKYLKKGDAVYIEGKLKKDTWEDDQGNKRSMVKVRGLSMQMIGGSKKSEQSQQPEQPQSDNSGGGEGEGGTDDLPFRRTPDKMIFKNKWF